MRSWIKIFREDYSGARLGMSMKELHGHLDKCERIMLDKFDKWRVGKTIINATPKRVAYDEVSYPHYVMLTVLYEEEG